MNEKAAAEFLKNAKGKVGILFHDDGDGICSAALLLAFFRKRGVETAIMPGKMEEDFYTAFANQAFDYYIIADMAADQYPELLAPLKGKRTLLVDHHPVHNDLNKVGIIHFNPRFERPGVYISASHCIYDLIGGPKESEWLMRLGAVCDKEMDGNDEEFEASRTLTAFIGVKKMPAYAKIAMFLSKCTKIDEFLYNETYQKIRKTFEKEIEKQIAQYELEASGNITFFEVKSRYNMTGILANRLFDLYPKRTIFIYRKKAGNMWSISGRSHNYNLGKIMAQAAEGPGWAGGHPVAAGAYVKDFNLFKKRLLELLK